MKTMYCLRKIINYFDASSLQKIILYCRQHRCQFQNHVFKTIVSHTLGPGSQTLILQLSTHITTQALKFRSSAEKMTWQKKKKLYSAEKVVRLKQFSAKKVVRPWPDRPYRRRRPCVTAKQISAFDFATLIVQSLYFLNSKFQASIHLLWLYSPVCVGPGRKPRKPVFSQRGS